MLEVAELCKIAVVDVLENGGRNLPSGKQDIIFSGNGRHRWMDVAQGVTNAGFEAGNIADKKIELVDMAQGAKVLAIVTPFMDEMMVELALCCNARTVASVGRKLGWMPSRG